MNVESTTNPDILSENESCDAPAFPALSLSHHPSSPRPDRLTAAPEVRGKWATTPLAGIDHFLAPADPRRNASDLSGRPRLNGEPLNSRKLDGGDKRTYTVTVVEELPNSLFALRWHDATLCNYEEQIWAPCLASTAGRCALSGEHIRAGDRVYRPRIRGRSIPLNSDAVILASALNKASTRA
ncbi:DUF3331 domain-containing protein [Paraburkholderia sp. DGU8]|jgi:hypothetical protein|uniref:DUF3331 domain-containing protein n=1 Tax=Paraburkholderia sp. DGU8 TaxID=3161997 RepID=UPI0034665E0C